MSCRIVNPFFMGNQKDKDAFTLVISNIEDLNPSLGCK